MREFLTVEYRLPRWGELSRPHSSGECRRRHAHGAQLIDGVHGVVVGKIEPFTGRRDVQNVEAGSAERAGGRLVHGQRDLAEQVSVRRDPCQAVAAHTATHRPPCCVDGKWRESDHLERAIETAGGVEAFEGEAQHLRQETQGWRLAEMRKRRGLTQTQVADRMGISVARVSQIENGDVSTREVLDRYVAALDGTLKLVADFGDEQLKVS
ncbi:helix-turn-helix domain-containing protein [Streptosporangium amethystogenes]|uniref:helix-turn-helix domain-containing protein n=1 Tax=Streptosporangium amethystogenes TaxID=2002 RepID=UPI001FE159C2|nr:helix-turn-helix transcriptional regulator [Streptosporangium amethystogenes]